MINKINIYEQLTTLPYLPAYQQLIHGAIELDVFSNLENPITTKELSKKMRWNESESLAVSYGTRQHNDDPELLRTRHL